MNKRKKLILSTIAALMFGLAGCQSSDTMRYTENNQTVTIPKSPSRIVVMNYGALDTLDALGKGTLVVGSPLTTLPNYLQHYRSVKVANTGSMKEPNFDVIKEAQPDLIIIDRRQAGKVNELVKIAPVINLDVDTKNYVESTKKHITVLGKMTGTESLAENYIQSLEVKLNEAQAIVNASNKKAILALHNDGKVMLTNDGGIRPALIHDVLQVKRAVPLSNIKLADGEKPIPIFINNEYIAKNKPDIVYLVDRSKAIGNKAMDKNYFDKNVLAKANTKVVYLTADIWYLSGGGAESLDRQIDEVMSAFN